ncbi:MAG: SPOR domain-containing protein [Alphaproteobacteria bacterium]|nr:MAG: SPOR domain-containing protein [Alphaproteobacteria bacterium]
MAALARPAPTSAPAAAPATQAPEGVAAIRPVAPLVIDGVEDTRAPAGPAVAPAAGEAAPAAGFVSPVPPPRPLPDRRIADDVARALAAVTGDGGVPASGGIDIAPEAVAPGTPTAQLGAFDSREAALKAWDEVARRNPAVLAGKKRLLIAAERAGKRFWRLRAVGFADRAEARNFCSVLVARGELCVSVLTR